MTPGQRIALIQESAELLAKHDYDYIDLVLGQFALPTSDYWQGTKTGYVVAMIKDATDKALNELHTFVTGEADLSKPGQTPWSGTKLRLFCSHLAMHRETVGEVRDALDRYGVDAFVAHTSIEPSMEWQSVIEAALMDCDAMVVFLHDGFVESRWCDQEVGWALGRRRPILPLNYGLHPYGFLGKLQDQPCINAHPVKVAQYIIDWLTKTPTLHASISHGLVGAFVNSGSWNFTRSIVPLLERIEAVSEEDLASMERAAETNVDVRECVVGDQTGPEWVKAFVARRRGPVEPPQWPQDEVPF